MDLGLSIFLAWGGAIAAGSLIGLAICCFFYVDDEYDILNRIVLADHATKRA